MRVATRAFDTIGLLDFCTARIIREAKIEARGTMDYSSRRTARRQICCMSDQDFVSNHLEANIMTNCSVFPPVKLSGAIAMTLWLLVSSAVHAQVDPNEEFQTAMEAGALHLEEGNFEEAITAFTEALAFNNFAPDAYAARATAFAEIEDFEAALKDYKEALDKNPQFVPALVGRGEIYLNYGAAELAIADFQAAVEQQRGNLRAVFGLGKSQILLGGAAQGLRNLDRAIAMDDQNHEAFRLRAQANAALGSFQEALIDIESSLSLEPDDHETYFVLGTIQLQMEEYVLALEALDQAIILYDPEQFEGMPYAQGYLTKAAVHIELGKTTDIDELRLQTYSDALADAEQLLQLTPESPQTAGIRAGAFHTKGVSHRLLGELGEAVAAFSEAIDLNPESSETYFRRGICFHHIDEDALALADFDQAAAINFVDPRAWLWQGFSHAKTGNWHEAVRAFGLAIAKSERYVPAYINRGLVYFKLGEYQKSVDDFNQAIRLEPTEAKHYFKRGLAYSLLGEHEKAAASFANAIEFDEDHVDAHLRLAEEMTTLGRNELAREYRARAAELQQQADGQADKAPEADPEAQGDLSEAIDSQP